MRNAEYEIIHDDINFIVFVIPGLTRNPVFSWIPAFAGMTSFAEINVPVYKDIIPNFEGGVKIVFKGKRVIVIGERDGVPGPAIANCVTAAGGQVVYTTTECFV
jgi:betaine reductase